MAVTVVSARNEIVGRKQAAIPKPSENGNGHVSSGEVAKLLFPHSLTVTSLSADSIPADPSRLNHLRGDGTYREYLLPGGNGAVRFRGNEPLFVRRFQACDNGHAFHSLFGPTFLNTFKKNCEQLNIDTQQVPKSPGLSMKPIPYLKHDVGGVIIREFYSKSLNVVVTYVADSSINPDKPSIYPIAIRRPTEHDNELLKYSTLELDWASVFPRVIESSIFLEDSAPPGTYRVRYEDEGGYLNDGRAISINGGIQRSNRFRFLLTEGTFFELPNGDSSKGEKRRIVVLHPADKPNALYSFYRGQPTWKGKLTPGATYLVINAHSREELGIDVLQEQDDNSLTFLKSGKLELNNVPLHFIPVEIGDRNSLREFKMPAPIDKTVFKPSKDSGKAESVLDFQLSRALGTIQCVEYGEKKVKVVLTVSLIDEAVVFINGRIVKQGKRSEFLNPDTEYFIYDLKSNRVTGKCKLNPNRNSVSCLQSQYDGTTTWRQVPVSKLKNVLLFPENRGNPKEHKIDENHPWYGNPEHSILIKNGEIEKAPVGVLDKNYVVYDPQDEAIVGVGILDEKTASITIDGIKTPLSSLGKELVLFPEERLKEVVDKRYEWGHASEVRRDRPIERPKRVHGRDNDTGTKKTGLTLTDLRPSADFLVKGTIQRHQLHPNDKNGNGFPHVSYGTVVYLVIEGEFSGKRYFEISKQDDHQKVTKPEVIIRSNLNVEGWLGYKHEVNKSVPITNKRLGYNPLAQENLANHPVIIEASRLSMLPCHQFVIQHNPTYTGFYLGGLSPQQFAGELLQAMEEDPIGFNEMLKIAKSAYIENGKLKFPRLMDYACERQASLKVNHFPLLRLLYFSGLQRRTEITTPNIWGEVCKHGLQFTSQGQLLFLSERYIGLPPTEIPDYVI